MSYECRSCIKSYRSGYRVCVQCDGTMRLILEAPEHGPVSEYLECDKCGRRAQPEDAPAE